MLQTAPVAVAPQARARTAHARVDEAACVGCGRCAAACPAGAIALGADGEARVDALVCRGCGACVQECRAGAIWLIEPRGAEIPAR
jgi:Pyruvate/2-oxoacid:ferredoxin oxidoreductase delta subunit